MCPKFESETSDDGQDPKQEALKCSGHGEQDIKSSEMVETAAMQPLQSVNGDDSDESDIVEHDVSFFFVPDRIHMYLLYETFVFVSYWTQFNPLTSFSGSQTWKS